MWKSERQTLDDYAHSINQKTFSFKQMPDAIRQRTFNFGLVTIQVSLYRIPLSDQVLQKSDLPTPDLSFWIYRSPDADSGYYDAQTHCLYSDIQEVLIVSRLDTRLKQDPESVFIRAWDKRAAGAVNGIPDLLNAQLVATISTPGAVGPLKTDVANRLQIKRLDIVVLDELYLTFNADGPYTEHIPGWTRALRMRQMRQLKGKDGEPLYVYQMPGSVAELVGSPSTP